VDRLCGKLFLITDSDNATKGAKAKRHETLKKKLEDRYYCLECTEIENLLTPEVIKAVVANYEGEQTALTDDSSLSEWRCIVSAASDPTVASRAGADRLLRTEPQVCLRCIHNKQVFERPHVALSKSVSKN
jgi:hypothetical protein